jgi:glutamate synthase domain-containing protein 2
VTLPDPLLEESVKAFERGSFKEFERHSRIGMVTEEGFMARAKELRDAGAKYVFLKTGAYRPYALAQALKYASKAKLDMLTVDGAGGGTGMSPWRMMNEWGVPTVELLCLLYQYCTILDKKGEHIPDIAVAGGFTFEDQLFKGLALGAPYFKIIGMARSPLAAAMVGKTIGRAIEEGQIPVFVERFGSSRDEIFVTAPELRHIWGKRFDDIPSGAIGVYTYFHRLAQGLRQLMCGSRKFTLDHMTRDDLGALTHEAAEVSGLPYIMDVDKEEALKLMRS